VQHETRVRGPGNRREARIESWEIWRKQPARSNRVPLSWRAWECSAACTSANSTNTEQLCNTNSEYAVLTWGWLLEQQCFSGSQSGRRYWVCDHAPSASATPALRAASTPTARCVRLALCATASRAGLRTAACAPETIGCRCQIVTPSSGQQGFLSSLFVDFVLSNFSQWFEIYYW